NEIYNTDGTRFDPTNPNYEGAEAITVKDNTANAVAWSSTGDSNLLVLDTTNGSEKVVINKELDITNSTSGASLMKVTTNRTTWNLENNNSTNPTVDQLRPSNDARTLLFATQDNASTVMSLNFTNAGSQVQICPMANSAIVLGGGTQGDSS